MSYLRLQKVFSNGKVLNENLYERLQALDAWAFTGCEKEFKPNAEWWVVVDKGDIIAYCASSYTDGVCLYTRAWVFKNYRGLGLHNKMIKARIAAAIAKKCNVIATYCTHTNPASANNLWRNGFKMFIPEYKYAGKEMIYFRRVLK